MGQVIAEPEGRYSDETPDETEGAGPILLIILVILLLLLAGIGYWLLF